MKKFLNEARDWFSPIACLAVLMTAVVFVGCKASQQRIAFNTLASIQTATVAAYDGYALGVVRKQIPTNDVPKVSQKFNLFQASWLVALDAVQYNTNALAPPSLEVISIDLLNLINKASKKPL